jgi:TP901 family phage tail tape measure protein
MNGLDSSTVSVLIKVLADNKGFNDAKKALQDYQESVKRGAEIVTGAVLATGVAAVGAAIYSAKAAADFQQSMNMLQTQAGASTKEVDNMKKAVLQLSTVTGTGPEELAQGIYHIESAGFRGAKALDMLKAAAEGAKIGNANLEDTTQAMISITASRIKGVKDENDAMAILNATVGAGDMKMEGLAQAMSTGIMPAAAAFGLSIQDVSAGLATLTDNAVPPIDAATRLRMAISMMGAPSGNAAKAMREIGMSSTQMADDMRSGGLMKALQDFQTHLKAIPPISESVTRGTKLTTQQIADLNHKISDTQQNLKIYGESHAKAGKATDSLSKRVGDANYNLKKYQTELAGAGGKMVETGGKALTLSQQQAIVAKAFGGGRESATILTLLGQMDRLNDKYKAITAGEKKFGEDWKKTQENVNFQMQQLGASTQVLAIKFGNILLPAVNQILTFLNTQGIPALQSFGGWVQKNQKVLEVIAGVITTIVMPPLIIWYTQMAVKNVKAAIDFIMWGDKIALNLIKQAAKFVFATVKIIAQTAAMVAVRIATGLWTAAQWLLNVALDANPIGIVIVIIAALVTGIIYAYNHSEKFRTIVNKLWEALKGFGGFLLKELMGAINFVVNGLKAMADAAEKAINAVGKAMSGKAPGHNAQGTNNWEGGMTWVGEAGPELINLPKGAQVIPNNKTQNYTGGGNGGSGDSVQITNYNTFNTPSDPNAFARRQAWQITSR